MPRLNSKIQSTIESEEIPIGFECKDRVTGFFGTIVSVCWGLDGQTQCLVAPNIDHDGKPVDAQWLDSTRCEITSESTKARDIYLENIK